MRENYIHTDYDDVKKNTPEVSTKKQWVEPVIEKTTTINLAC